MKEHPIIFSAPMVRALLDSSKTQTRRAVKLKPADMETLVNLVPNKSVCCPYGQPGDRLWVREAWRTVAGADKIPPRDLNTAYRLWFEADVPHQPGCGKYRPGMFMPRWASRITLEVTGVRVERLQDISEADARAEGARECDPVSGREVLLAGPSQRGSYVLHYRDIWEQINGPGSWDTNPWVWVIEFRRVTQ